jgi:hypothetical protein
MDLSLMKVQKSPKNKTLNCGQGFESNQNSFAIYDIRKFIQELIMKTILV